MNGEKEKRRNPKVTKFEDLLVWQESLKLAIEIYETLNDVTDFDLRNQMQKAAVSVPSNISEGFERNTNKDFIHFLYIAKGSCSELRTQMYLAKAINLISTIKLDELIEQSRKISGMLQNYINTRKRNF